MATQPGQGYQTHVSFSDQMTDPMSRRKEVGLSQGAINELQQAEVPMVSMTPRGEAQYAVVGLRTSLVGRRPTAEQWRLIIDPFNVELTKRLLDVPSGTIVEGVGPAHASTDAMEALTAAHDQIRQIGQPEPGIGTVIRVWVGFTLEGKPWTRLEASSLSAVKREHAHAVRENARRMEAAKVYLPWTKRVLWSWPYDRLVVPDVPKSDVWMALNGDNLAQLIQLSFVPVLQSLWKAAFATGFPAENLREQGMPMTEIGKTVVTGKPLKELVMKNSGRLNRTMFEGGH